MSIIEKALSKGGDKKPEMPAADAQNPESASDHAALIEQAIAKAESRSETRPEVSAEASRTSDPTHPQFDSNVALDTQTSRQLNLDASRLRSRGFLTSDAERGQMAEEYRMIKRPLLANAFGANPVKKGNMVMVTSSLPGEGKSFSAINLAISIAMELDRTVLLVDADVAKPRIPDYLGFRAEHGLLDILRGEVRDLSSVIFRTNIDKLAIMPAGRTYARATELLASEAMDRLIADLATRYADRLVLFDSPPLLATSESNVLASHMGQIVMVVEADKTPKSALREALSRIEGACDVVGIVLNKAESPKASGYSYYGYGGYGGYGGYNQPK